MTREYLLSRPAACFPIKSPPAVNVRGYYPTQSCIRYHSQANEYTVSMEGFTLREASAPEADRVSDDMRQDDREYSLVAEKKRILNF